MKLTRKHHVYLGFLGLGLMALCLDRTILAPSEAEGNSTPLPGAPPLTPRVVPGAESLNANPDEVSNSRTTVSVANQLRRLADRNSLDPAAIRDAFRPAESWFSDDGTSSRKTPDQIVREFKASNELLGVLFSRGQSKAMMSISDPEDPGELKRIVLPVGESIDLFKLVKLDERSALFERGSLQILLELKRNNESDLNP